MHLLMDTNLDHMCDTNCLKSIFMTNKHGSSCKLHSYWPTCILEIYRHTLIFCDLMSNMLFSWRDIQFIVGSVKVNFLNYHYRMDKSTIVGMRGP